MAMKTSVEKIVQALRQTEVSERDGLHAGRAESIGGAAVLLLLPCGTRAMNPRF